MFQMGFATKIMNKKMLREKKKKSEVYTIGNGVLNYLW